MPKAIVVEARRCSYVTTDEIVMTLADLEKVCTVMIKPVPCNNGFLVARYGVNKKALKKKK